MSDLRTEYAEILRLTKQYVQQMQELGECEVSLATGLEALFPETPLKSTEPLPVEKQRPASVSKIPRPPKTGTPHPSRVTSSQPEGSTQIPRLPAADQQAIDALTWDQRVKAAHNLYQQVYRQQLYHDADSLFLQTSPTSGTGENPIRSLEMLHVAFHQCQRCSLGKTRTNFVFGVGNPHADLVFCGEAPGEQEDLKGEPFVGRAGQLLDKILAAIHLHRNDVYILNVLKCRPPGNRDPLPEEREACRPLLEAQLALIKPKVICALGRQAAQALLKTNQSLGKLRGQFHDFNGIPLMVTYHPAALLRNPHWKRPTWDDMQMLRDYYHQLNP